MWAAPASMIADLRTTRSRPTVDQILRLSRLVFDARKAIDTDAPAARPILKQAAAGVAGGP